ncbi:MAG TPA: AAA family ATPase [Mycobacteriales bacterium]|nr:AAA family ATPase [Mycobacteriales bacterium]
MARVVVVGVSGSGKTTLSRALAARLGAPHVELDALWHDEGWTSPTRPEFVERVRAATAGDAWVVDGNYAEARPVIWARATHVVWLDYPRWLGLQRVLRRTAVRVVTRRPLWNGNRERLRTVLSAEHPIRWGWNKHPHYRARYAEMYADPAYSHVVKVRLRGPAETRRWLDSDHDL